MDGKDLCNQFGCYQLPPVMNKKENRFQGFTLVEMAVVLVILGLLLSALLIPLSAQIDQRNYTETQKHMDEIREALIGYGASHGYLPCPAVSASNGSEDRSANTCTGNKRVGFLPWAELGVPKLDSWGHLYRYSVTLAYADSTTKISMAATGDITIQTRDSTGSLVNMSKANSIQAAVVSFGKNGALAYNDDGTQIANGSATNVDEVTNATGSGTTFVSRTFTDNTATTGGEFDDIVVWLSPNVYLNRMISAGQLP